MVHKLLQMLRCKMNRTRISTATVYLKVSLQLVVTVQSRWQLEKVVIIQVEQCMALLNYIIMQGLALLLNSARAAQSRIKRMLVIAASYIKVLCNKCNFVSKVPTSEKHDVKGNNAWDIHTQLAAGQYAKI